MSNIFKIVPGRYHIPNIGFVDSNSDVSDETALSIYKLPRRVFPFISLGPDAFAYLKKQKLPVKEIASLVKNARTAEEIEILTGLSRSKTIKRIIETKLKALENEK
jgi:hypothetical protein